MNAKISKEEFARVQPILDRLFNGEGRQRNGAIIDYCYTAFMRAKEANPDDGGPTDWFTDTKPHIDKLIAGMRRDVESLMAAALAAHASSPEPETPKPDRNRDSLLALLLNRRIDHHDVNACEAEAWGDGLPECVKYHNGQAKAYRGALEALERDVASSRHSDGERR